MGADNTFGETNFNPDQLKVKESIADIVSDLKQLPSDAKWCEFEYNNLEYYLSFAFTRSLTPIPTPIDLPQEYRYMDEIWMFSFDVFDKEGKETYDKDGIVKQIIEQYNA